MPRRHDLGAFYRDVHRALDYVPPDPNFHAGDVHRHDGSLGTVIWWACHCGAHAVAENENKAADGLAEHLKKDKP